MEKHKYLVKRSKQKLTYHNIPPNFKNVKRVCLKDNSFETIHKMLTFEELKEEHVPSNFLCHHTSI